MESTVCQTCGDIGYQEALVYCSKCQNCAEHRYCMSNLLDHFCEDVTWFCDQCALAKSTSQVEDPSLQSCGRKSKRKLQNHITKSAHKKPTRYQNLRTTLPFKSQSNADLVADDINFEQQPVASNFEDQDLAYDKKEVLAEINGVIGSNGCTVEGLCLGVDGSNLSDADAITVESDTIAALVSNAAMSEMTCKEKVHAVDVVSSASDRQHHRHNDLHLFSSGKPNSGIHAEEKLNRVHDAINDSSSVRISSLQPDEAKCAVSAEIHSISKVRSTCRPISTYMHMETPGKMFEIGYVQVNEEGSTGYADTVEDGVTYIKGKESTTVASDAISTGDSCILPKNIIVMDAAVINVGSDVFNSEDNAHPGASDDGRADNRVEPRLLLESANENCDDNVQNLLSSNDQIGVNADSSWKYRHTLKSSHGKDSPDDSLVLDACFAFDGGSSDALPYAPAKLFNSGTMQESCSSLVSAVNSVLIDDLHCSALPILEPVWSGSFDICAGFYGSVMGYLSRKAGMKVFEAARSLPPTLFLEERPRIELWPETFKRSPPTRENIAMFFFPGSNCQTYMDTVNDVTRRDLGLKFTLADSELLIFSSIHLPKLYPEFHGKTYLWGVFCARKDLVTLPLITACSKSEVEPLESMDLNELERTNLDNNPTQTREFPEAVSDLCDDLHDYTMATDASKTDDGDHSNQMKLDSLDEQKYSIALSSDCEFDKNVEPFGTTSYVGSIPCPGANDDLIAHVRFLCSSMNSVGLSNIIIKSKFSMKTLRHQMPQLLRNCADPPCFVLDCISRFLILDHEITASDRHEMCCLMLLTSLCSAMESLESASSKMFLTPETKERARAITDSWKKKCQWKNFSEVKTPLPHARTFLMLVVTFGIIDKAEKPFYEKLVRAVSTREIVPKLAVSLGLGHNFLMVLIRQLIKNHHEFVALNFICEAGLLKTFSLITLFDSYLTNKKAAGKSKRKVALLFINSIRRFGVDSAYHVNSLNAHVHKLEQQVGWLEEVTNNIQKNLVLNPKTMPINDDNVKIEIQHVTASVLDHEMATVDEFQAQSTDSSLPSRSSQFRAPEEIDYRPAIAACNLNASKKSSLLAKVKTLCTEMNIDGFWNLIKSSKSALSILRPQLPQLLMVCVDPFLFVLDAVSRVLIPDSKVDSAGSHEGYCLVLLNSLPSVTKSSTPSSKNLFVAPSTQKKARAIADSWKEKFLEMWSNSKAKALMPSYAQTFLMLVTTFGILDEAEKPLYEDLVTVLATRKAIPKLAISLNLEHDFFRCLIHNLKKRGHQLSALNFICEVGLLEEFPAVPLLESYLNSWKKTDVSKQLQSLQTVVNKISQYKLDYPVDSLKTRINELENQVNELTKEANNSSQRQDAGKDVENMPEIGLMSPKDSAEHVCGSVEDHDKVVADEFQSKSTACLLPSNCPIQSTTHDKINQSPLNMPLISGELKKDDLATNLSSIMEKKITSSPQEQESKKSKKHKHKLQVTKADNLPSEVGINQSITCKSMVSGSSAGKWNVWHAKQSEALGRGESNCARTANHPHKPVRASKNRDDSRKRFAAIGYDSQTLPPLKRPRLAKSANGGYPQPQHSYVQYPLYMHGQPLYPLLYVFPR